MTGHEILNRRIRRGMAMVVAGIIVVILSCGTLARPDDSPFFVFAAALVIGGILFIAGYYALQTLRCPWCGEKAVELFFSGLKVNHVKFCPHCGKSLDDEFA